MGFPFLARSFPFLARPLDSVGGGIDRMGWQMDEPRQLSHQNGVYTLFFLVVEDCTGRGPLQFTEKQRVRRKSDVAISASLGCRLIGVCFRSWSL